MGNISSVRESYLVNSGRDKTIPMNRFSVVPKRKLGTSAIDMHTKCPNRGDTKPPVIHPSTHPATQRLSYSAIPKYFHLAKQQHWYTKRAKIPTSAVNYLPMLPSHRSRIHDFTCRLHRPHDAVTRTYL